MGRIKELGTILNKRYNNALQGEKVTMIYLFAISYAKEIRQNHYSVAEIVSYSKIKKSYTSEVLKGINLKKYVEIDDKNYASTSVMTFLELGKILEFMYCSTKEEKESATAVRLFGVRYATEIKNCQQSVKAITISAGISKNYAAEISKGIKLSKYVKCKSIINDKFDTRSITDAIKQPIIKSRFKKLQETGLQAETYFKNKHKNYEILNLIGYGLSKFNNEFIKQFGFSSKNSFYQFCVDNKIAKTVGTIKNRMDLFDHFFPENGRKGWWQKGDAYIHRKQLIDNLFGNEAVQEYANIVKMRLADNFSVKNITYQAKPIIKSRFKKLQETGLEAELFFINNYNSVEIFENGLLEDARLYGDGYDFQISINQHSYLAEVKGIRENKGKFRLTENEYNKALDYKDDYIVSLVLNLNKYPRILTIENPIKNLSFDEKITTPKAIKEYHLSKEIC